MPLPPSRRDFNAPPKRDLSSLASRVRHHDSYLRSLDPGIQDGRFRTLQPVAPGSSQLVGGADGGGDAANYEWQWDDRGTVLGPGTQVFVLTYQPVEESLFVRWHPGGLNGFEGMTNENFTVDGRTVTVPDYGFFAAGDRFSFQYQFDPAVSDEPAAPQFIGATLITDTNVTSIACPAGTQPGDLLVLAAASADVTSCSDSRMVGDAAFAGWAGGGMVRWGLTGTTLPVACVVSGGPFTRTAAVLAAYRGVAVDSYSTQSSGTEDITYPVMADGFGAIGVILNWEGVVHGAVNPDTTAAWNRDTGASATKNNVAVDSWATDTQAPNPAGAFHHGGNSVGLSATTLRVSSTS